jgi:steroid delta-isomerase-like uncharacterized protein
MSLQEHKSVVRRWIEEVWNRWDLLLAEEIVDPDFTFHGTNVRGIEGHKTWVAASAVAFPDQHHTIEDMIAEGDKVVIRLSVSGTHQGKWAGIAPTGKRATWTGISIVRVTSGRIAELWMNWDAFGFYQQLGAIALPEEE